MKRLSIVAFYVFMIVDIIYTISNYETLTLSQMLFFTVICILFGGSITLDLVNLIMSLVNKEGE